MTLQCFTFFLAASKNLKIVPKLFHIF
ncbi:hypothetical protein PT2222_120262 [Paraburkholderia tropica]